MRRGVSDRSQVAEPAPAALIPDPPEVETALEVCNARFFVGGM